MLQVKRLLNWRYQAPRYTEDAEALEGLFQRLHDPWHFLTDPYEAARYAHLQEMVLTVPHRSVLEVGCAEGAFTAWLTTVAENVVALDISATACERARARAPRAVVLEANFAAYEPEAVFDLVVCSEALYYVRDPEAALARLLQMARLVLLSYTRHERIWLDPIVARFPPALVDKWFFYRVRRFPPKKRGCRCLLFGGAASGDISSTEAPASIRSETVR